MDNQNQKSQAFVSRLLQNPALRECTPLQREQQIVQFLQQNADALYPTLSSAQFFPGKPWGEILRVLVAGLSSLTNDAMTKELERLLWDRLQFSYVGFLKQNTCDHDTTRKQLNEFLRKMLMRAEARREFAASHVALAHSLVERYVEEAFRRREYVYFELAKVQRLDLGRVELVHLLGTSMLLKPCVHLVTGNGAASHGDQATVMVLKHYADKALEVVATQLPCLPAEVIRSGVYGNLSYLEHPFLEATARVTAILHARCRSYRPSGTVDRGADTPDKSWFSIARRNYKYYGFDIKMLDEFYKIAAERGW